MFEVIIDGNETVYKFRTHGEAVSFAAGKLKEDGDLIIFIKEL